MEIRDKVIIVTGGANGIGKALCHKFAQEGAAHIVVVDRDEQNANLVAQEVGGTAKTIDVAQDAEIKQLVEETEAAHGRIDLFCSNAGISVEGGPEATDEGWQRIWQVNVMAHVYAARAALPGMLKRGSGYLLNTASAAGLLSQIGSAPYSVTKHAAVAFAEWLSITYHQKGIRVSCLCPQGVDTNLLQGTTGGIGEMLRESMLTPEQVADDVLSALREERFLVTPHEVVKEYFQRKASDYDRWLRGMRRLQEKYLD